MVQKGRVLENMETLEHGVGKAVGTYD